MRCGAQHPINLGLEQAHAMDLELQGRHVLITGGSKGIGLACGRAFLNEGAEVSLIARSIEGLGAAAKWLNEAVPTARNGAFVYAADLRDAVAAKAAIVAIERNRGCIDILVNCAGAAKRTPPEELTPPHWHDAMEAKFFTYMNVIDPLIKLMGERGHGVILNVVGIGGKIAGPLHLAGGAANAALMLATAGLAAIYGPKGIRVNAVNPAMTMTERLKEGIAMESRYKGITTEEVLAHLGSSIPLRRAAEAAEVASVVVFLCSSRASYVSGAMLSMDGAATPIVV